MLVVLVLPGDWAPVCSSYFRTVSAQAVCISAFAIGAHHLTSMPLAAWENPFLFEPCHSKLQLEQAPPVPLFFD